MTQMVTRCPKCGTAFRITSTQIESAKGAVRCGSCLHIFKAQDHIVKTISEATKPASNHSPAPAASPATITTPAAIQATTHAVSSATPKTPAPTPAEPAPAKPIIDKAKILADEDDILISDDMDKNTEKSSTYEFDGFLDLDLQPKQSVSLFEREIRYDTPSDEETETADESWAEELLDDSEDDIKQLRKPPATPTPPAVPEHSSIEAQINAAFEANKADQPSSTYKAPVFSIVAEAPAGEEQDFSEEFINATSAGGATSNPSSPAAQEFATALFAEDEDQPAKAQSSKRPVKSADKIRATDTSRAALLMNIMPAPVEFTAKRMRRWYQEKLWPSLAVLAAITLIFQIAYFKFDYFSRTEPYRTAYVLACPVFNCKVPVLVDTRQLVATNLVVRNHPTAEQALKVDAILINNASFEQPFPDLIMAFSTLDGTPVASRRFSPKEYLGGELAGMEHIPIKQPVHIILELADPGPDAVNYHLSIP